MTKPDGYVEYETEYISETHLYAFVKACCDTKAMLINKRAHWWCMYSFTIAIYPGCVDVFETVSGTKLSRLT